MPKYYIPLVMVIEAPDYEYATLRVDGITSALCSLALGDLEGFAEIDNLESTEAPDAWYEEDLYVTTDGQYFSLTTEAL